MWRWVFRSEEASDIERDHRVWHAEGVMRSLCVIFAASALVACGGNLDVEPRPDASGTTEDASTAPEADVGVGPQDSGAGADVCAAPSVVCAGACVDTQTDPANCGGCGVTCGGTCQNARCVVQLATGMGIVRGAQLALDTTTVYWTGGGSVQRVAKTGGPTTTLVSTNENANGLALDATYVYFAMAANTGTSGYIGRVALGGGAAETVVSGDGDPESVALAGGDVVWTADTQAPSTFGPVDIVSLDGGTPLVLNSFASPSTPPVIVGDMVVDCQEALPEQLEEDPLAGPLSPINPLVLAKDLAACPSYVVADPSSLYWTDGSLLTKVALSGGAITTLASSTDSMGALAVDGVDVYYAAYDPNTGGVASVQKVPVGGGAATTLVTQQSGALSLAVDDTSVYFLGTTGLFKVTPK